MNDFKISMSPRYAANIEKLRSAQKSLNVSMTFIANAIPLPQMAVSDLDDALALCDYILAAKNIKPYEKELITRFRARVLVCEGCSRKIKSMLHL